MNPGPILVYDSGIGALGIADAIAARLPRHSLALACDNAAHPYGDKSPARLRARVQYIAAALVAHCRPSLMVLACNSASTLALDALRERLHIPVVGVVPAIKTAARLSTSRHIGLLCTPATARRPYTMDLVRKFADDCQVLIRGSGRLVAMVEAWAAGRDPDAAQLAAIMEPFRNCRNLDALVLGCTHFPLILPQLRSQAPAIRHWVHSAAAVADQVARLAGPPAARRRLSALHSAAPGRACLQLLARHGFADAQLLPSCAAA